MRRMISRLELLVRPSNRTCVRCSDYSVEIERAVKAIGDWEGQRRALTTAIVRGQYDCERLGVVRNYDETRGFGFIRLLKQCDNGGAAILDKSFPDIFFMRPS